MSKKNLIIIGLVVVCVAVAGFFIQQALKRDLSFSEVTVECTAREGSSGGRFATYVVEGTVRNANSKDCGAEDLPLIITDDGIRKPKATLPADTLASGDSCEVTYEGEFNMRDLEAPHLRFTCDLTFEGLDEAEGTLNEGLRKLYDEYAEEVAIAHENTEAQASLREQARKSLEDCVGKTAKEAQEVADEADYAASFVDTQGTDVSASVKDEDGPSARDARVTDVKIKSSGPGGDSVTFTLDYEDPDVKELLGCVGKTADEALKVAQGTALTVSFMDAEGANVTSAITDEKSQSKAHTAKVASVRFSGKTAVVTLDYTDETLKATRDAKARVLACKGMSAKEAYEVSKEVGYLAFFHDSKDEDVTLRVMDEKGFQEVKKALVESVVMKQMEGVDIPTVTFELDHVAPDALALRGCKTKSADEALKVAKERGCGEITFTDSDGEDVTSRVTDPKSGSKAHEQSVSRVKLTMTDPAAYAVTFTLDYVDEDAKREREEREAKKALESCVGASAAEAYEVAKGLDYTAYFKDTADVDVTADVRDGSGASGARSAKVMGAAVSTGDSVTFTLDYLDPEAARELEATKVLTVDNCEDFAKLVSLVDNLDPFVAEFANKYAGRTIEFDAIILDVMHHGNYETRYDYLIGAGSSYEHTRGPNFKFENINYADFHWVGNGPEDTRVRTLLHIVAKVDRYNSVQGLFFLKPVETSVR